MSATYRYAAGKKNAGTTWQQGGNSAIPTLVPEKVKKVEKKLDLITSDGIEVAGNDQLHDAIGIYIVSHNRKMVYTIHHPIGIHDLKSSDFVFSSGLEVATMLTRTKDPSESQLSISRGKYLLKLMVDAGLLVKKDDRIYYPPGSGDISDQERSAVITAATSLCKMAKASAQAAADAEAKSEDRKPSPVKFDKTNLNFLSSDGEKYEKYLRKWETSEEVQSLIEELFPRAYFTGKGEFGLDHQEALDFEGLKTPSQVFDLICKHVTEINKKVKPSNRKVPRSGADIGNDSVGDVKEKKKTLLATAKERASKLFSRASDVSGKATSTVPSGSASTPGE